MRTRARLLALALGMTVLLSPTAAQAATRPSAPRSVKAGAANQAVRVSWLAPTLTGGAVIDGYAVQRRTSTGAAWQTLSHSYLDAAISARRKDGEVRARAR